MLPGRLHHRVIPRVLALLCLWAAASALVAQRTGQWGWMQGTNSAGAPAIYGTKGVATPQNVPGARDGAATWTDQNGNFWMFGGQTTDGAGHFYFLNDLWMYSTVTNEWTWMSGSSTPNVQSVYGTQWTPDAGNVPGARAHVAAWTDFDGNFWMLGGDTRDANGVYTEYNDLWLYSVDTNEWTWMGGANQPNAAGVYGRQGKFSTRHAPGARDSAMAWTDQVGDLWLFGGSGMDANGVHGYLNDLWHYSIATDEWTWVSGSRTVNGTGNYGTQYVADAANTPGARVYGTTWVGKDGTLWLFGGYNGYGDGWDTDQNDLWSFSTATGEWTWIGGPPGYGMQGLYGTKGMADAGNWPGARDTSVGWVDSSGNLWMFGGESDSIGWPADQYNDLWMFNQNTDMWTWVSGENDIDSAGVFGLPAVFDAGNEPPARGAASAWMDVDGNLWFQGGFGMGGNGYQYSLNDMWEYSFEVVPTATPVITPDGGTYETAQVVSIADSNPLAAIYYTTDGSTPTANSTLYTGPFLVSTTETVQAIGAAIMLGTSATASASYIIEPKTATPQFTPGAGTYGTAQAVILTDTTPGAVIHYTTDGSTPTANSAVYTGPVTVSATETLAAMAVAQGRMASAAGWATYTIQHSINATTISLSGTPAVQFLNRTMTFTAAVTGSGGTPTGTVTFFADGNAWGIGTLVNGVAVFTGAWGVAGQLNVTATYNGDGNFGGSASNVVTETLIDFAMHADTGFDAQTIHHGDTVTYTFTVTPAGADVSPEEVDFSVDGAPGGTGITFTPNVLAKGAGHTSITLTVKTADTPGRPGYGAENRGGPALGRSSGAVAVCLLLGVGLVPLGWRLRRRGVRLLAIVLLLAAGAMGLAGVSGCGTGWNVQNLNLTINAQSGGLTHILAIPTLTVE